MQKAGTFKLVELKVNYRTPQEVMDVAGGLLVEFAPELRPAISIRHSGEPVVMTSVGTENFFGHVAAVVRKEVGLVEPGTVALIVPPAEKTVYLEELARAGLYASASPEETLSVLSIHEAKGLEFDSVVISGANRLLAAGASNLQALFVAMTRTTKRNSADHPGGKRSQVLRLIHDDVSVAPLFIDFV